MQCEVDHIPMHFLGYKQKQKSFKHLNFFVTARSHKARFIIFILLDLELVNLLRGTPLSLSSASIWNIKAKLSWTVSEIKLSFLCSVLNLLWIHSTNLSNRALPVSDAVPVVTINWHTTLLFVCRPARELLIWSLLNQGSSPSRCAQVNFHLLSRKVVCSVAHPMSFQHRLKLAPMAYGCNCRFFRKFRIFCIDCHALLVPV